MQPDLPRRLAAEAIGTFGFFFIGFTGLVTLQKYGFGGILSIGVAAGFGFGLALMIFAFGHLSGGHFNPAVTTGLAVARRFPVPEVAPYWVAQLIGGGVAALLTRILFHNALLKGTLTLPGPGISNGRALVLEAVFTMFLVLVVATVATDKRAAWNGVFAPFAIGLTIFTAATVAGPMSGGSFNPARSIDPALLSGKFTSLWIYIVGPLAGGLLGGAIHSYFHPLEPAEQ
jgi:MIP family channel proteins